MSRYSPILKKHNLYDDSDKSLRWHIWNNADDDYEPVGGWTIELNVAEEEGGTTLVSKDATVINAATGFVEVAWTVADSSTLGAGEYWYQLCRTTFSQNDVLADGEFTLRPRNT